MMPVFCSPEGRCIMPKKRRLSKKAAAKRLGITPAAARAYVARWKRVDAHIAAERRAMSPQEEFDELARLMQWPQQFGWPDGPPEDDREVWNCWNKLREAHRG
jgi:hypothetical protein